MDQHQVVVQKKAEGGMAEWISTRQSLAVARRAYTTQAVDEQTIRRVIDAAVHAPNAVNQQPWTFTIVRDQALLDRFSRDAKSHMLVTMPAGAQSDHFRSLLSNSNFQITATAVNSSSDPDRSAAVLTLAAGSPLRSSAFVGSIPEPILTRAPAHQSAQEKAGSYG